MPGATSTIHVLLAGVLGLTPPVAAGEPGPRRLPVVDLGDPQELALPVSPAVLAAQRLADSGRYDQAAVAYEALAREQGDVRLIYHAGSMRAKAGQYALAARHYQSFLERAGGLESATRAYVDRRLVAARGQVVGIRIVVVEAAGGGKRAIAPELLAQATLRLETVGGETGAAIVLANYRGEDVFVDRAPVVVHLAIPGFMPLSQLRSATGGETTWELVVARQKVTVDLRFAPERALRGARLQIQPTDGASTPGVDRALESPAVTVQLTTGSWQVDVTGRRHEAHTSLVVTPGMRPVAIALQRRGSAGGQQFSRSDTVAAVLGGAFVVTAVTGLGLLIAGQVKEAKIRRRNEAATMDALLAADGSSDASGLDMLEEAYPTAQLYRDLDRSFNLTTAGGVVVLSSLGALLAGVTAGSRLKRRVVALEMGVGALFAGAGAGWMAYAIDRQDTLLTPGEPEARHTWSDLKAGSGHRAGATVLLGLGAGLVVFPALALVTDAAHNRRQRKRGLAFTPTFGRDRIGLAIGGRF